MNSLQRTKAIIYLKEVLNQNRNLAANSVSLEYKKDSPQDFRVRIRVQDGDKNTIRVAAQKYSLEVKEENNELIIS